eukprot:1143893-Pelagomonas_calceolata.AAC.6
MVSGHHIVIALKLFGLHIAIAPMLSVRAAYMVPTARRTSWVLGAQAGLNSCGCVTGWVCSPELLTYHCYTCVSVIAAFVAGLEVCI